jgi:hypothetical protein
MTELIKVETYFVKTKVENHNEIKQSLLELIESMGTHSIIEQINDIYNGQKISNTDWHLSSSYNRTYFHLFNNIATTHLLKVKEILQLKENLNIANYWFQQYKKNDFHGYHNHGGCLYSNIYYVDLPEKNLQTTFKILDKEFEINVEEGDILTFPSNYMHCSKSNQFDYTKTIISFNVN